MIVRDNQTPVVLTLVLLAALAWAVFAFILGEPVPISEVQGLSVFSEGLTSLVVFIGLGASMTLSIKVHRRSKRMLEIGFGVLFFACFQDMLDELVTVPIFWAVLIEDFGMPVGFILVGFALIEAERHYQANSDRLAYSEALQERLRFCDQLTQLSHRHSFFIQAARLHKRTLDASKPCSLISLHIANISEANHRHGYEMGDMIILKVAKQLHRVLEQQGASHALASRLNGSNFVLLLAGSSQVQAQEIVESVRMLSAHLALPQRYEKSGVFAINLEARVIESEEGESFRHLFQRLSRPAESESVDGDTKTQSHHA